MAKRTMSVLIYYKGGDSVYLDLQYPTLTQFVEDFKAKGWWYVEIDVPVKSFDIEAREVVEDWGKQAVAIPWHAVTEIKEIK